MGCHAVPCWARVYLIFFRKDLYSKDDVRIFKDKVKDILGEYQ